MVRGASGQHNCSQNLLVKTLSLSDTIDWGMPCTLIMFLRNASATFGAVKSAGNGMKWANFDNQSTTKITEQP